VGSARRYCGLGASPGWRCTVPVHREERRPFPTWAVSQSLAAVIPIAVLLGGIGLFRLKAHLAALFGLLSSLVIAVLAFRMPIGMAFASAVYGGAFGFLPIGWIVLNVIFLYQLTLEKGSFTILQESIAAITRDRRLQLVFIAFSLGAFFEGAAGFGTPVAVTGAMLIGVGFRPLQASGLSLIANTAPVAYGALGTPIIALSGVTGLDLHALSGMVGRQLPFFSVIVPFWLIWSFAGFRGMLQVWPALLVAGVTFAVPQYLVSNFHGPWLVDVVGALISLSALTLFLRVWQPREIWLALSRHEEQSRRATGNGAEPAPADNPVRNNPGRSPVEVIQAWLPWVVLSIFVFLWGLPQVKAFLDGDLAAQDSGSWPPQSDPKGSASGTEADARGCSLQLYASVCDRNEHPFGGDRQRVRTWLFATWTSARFLAYVCSGSLFASNDCVYVGYRLRYALFRH
jgi:lactate permease